MRRTFCIISCLAAVLSLSAGEIPDRYCISVAGMYGWNGTWGSHGGADITARMPIHRFFESTAAAEIHSPGIYSFSVTARPKYGLPVGEIFADGTAHCRILAPYAVSELNLAISAGYGMDYVSVQLGAAFHFTFDNAYGAESGQAVVRESPDFLYRIAFNLRPSTSRWNAGAGIANFTEFEYMRSLSPLYLIHGHYDLNGNLSVLMKVNVKPSGTLHMNARFWGITLKAGIKYSF